MVVLSQLWFFISARRNCRLSRTSDAGVVATVDFLLFFSVQAYYACGRWVVLSQPLVSHSFPATVGFLWTLDGDVVATVGFSQFSLKAYIAHGRGLSPRAVITDST